MSPNPKASLDWISSYQHYQNDILTSHFIRLNAIDLQIWQKWLFSYTNGMCG